MMDINPSQLSEYITDRPPQGSIRTDSSHIAQTSDTAKANNNTPRPDPELKQQELKEGQILKGEVMDLRLDEVKIRIEPGGRILTARLTGDISLYIGQKAEFVVSESTSDHLTLRYLPQEIDQYPAEIIQKALEASNLPMSERNSAIIMELLNNHMPIDKQTLKTLAKAALMNKGAVADTLVLMYKNHIPLTPENIRQFEAYRNGTHSILNKIHELTETITEFIRQEATAENHNQPGAYGMIDAALKESLSQLMQDKAGQPTAMMDLNTVAAPVSAASDNPSDTAAAVSDTMAAAVVPDATATAAVPDTTATAAVTDTTATAAVTDTTAAAALWKSAAGAAADPGLGHLVNEILAFVGMSEHTPIGRFLSNDELSLLADELGQKMIKCGQFSPDSRAEILRAIQGGTISLSDTVTLVRSLYETSAGAFDPQVIPDAGSRDAAAQEPYAAEAVTLSILKRYAGLTSPEFSHMVAEELRQRWTVTPEKLSKKTPLTELYRNLKEDLEKLDKLIRFSRDLSDKPRFEEPVRNLNENLRFMKALNELVTYVQLPVQFKDRDVHGDLYVFHNKKKNHEKKNSLQVLLHLEMSSLGTIDIRMNMIQNQIQAAFIPEYPASGRIISEHLPELADTLSKKGYHLQARIEKEYQKQDFIKDILGQDSPDGTVHRYSFDLRV